MVFLGVCAIDLCDTFIQFICVENDKSMNNKKLLTWENLFTKILQHILIHIENV